MNSIANAADCDADHWVRTVKTSEYGEPDPSEIFAQPGVAEQRLDLADVVAPFEQVGGETVAEGVGRHALASFMGAIGLAIAGYDVPHAVLVWALVLGIIGSVAGSPALAKRRSAGRGFEVVPPDERRPG